jgi:phosphoserine phosphatase
MTNPFVRSVLELRPKVAVFDCDGTLWNNNSGEDFLMWSMERGMVKDEVIRYMRARYAAYKRGNVDETQMCGEMTSMFAGLSVAAMQNAAQRFFAAVVRPNYFHELRELVLGLSRQGCELWAVSSTNEWVIKEGIRDLRIPQEHALAACVEIEDGVATDRLVRVPSGRSKVDAIRESVHKPVDAVFGNSIHDVAMLEVAQHAFAVNPNPDLETLAQQRGWTVYWPERTRVAL